jgi:hypothetical protein
MKPLPKCNREFDRLPSAVQSDGVADVIHHDLTGITVCQVPLKLRADPGLHRSVDVVAEESQEFFALHGRVGRPVN